MQNTMSGARRSPCSCGACSSLPPMAPYPLLSPLPPPLHRPVALQVLLLLPVLLLLCILVQLVAVSASQVLLWLTGALLLLLPLLLLQEATVPACRASIPTSMRIYKAELEVATIGTILTEHGMQQTVKNRSL